MQFESDGSAPLRTAHEWVRARLRDAIFTGEYPPGSRLVQTEIAEHLGTSVTPVREAMRDLVNEGLISADPHRAATVRPIDIDDAIEINELRLVLEPMAARRAAGRITPSRLDELRRLEAEMESADDNTWLELNRRFHLTVIDAAGSPRLGAILVNLRQISTFYLAAYVRTTGVDRAKSAREHTRLIAALEAGDGELAEQVMAQHLAESGRLKAGLDAALRAPRPTA